MEAEAEVLYPHPSRRPPLFLRMEWGWLLLAVPVPTVTRHDLGLLLLVLLLLLWLRWLL